MADQAPTAMSGKGHPPYEEEFRVIGQILERDAEQIMERWFVRAGEEQVHSAPHERTAAMNELFEMLQSIGQRLHQQSSRAMEEAKQLARDHGEQRSGLGWDVIDVVRDYEILHGVALEHLGQALDERLTYRQAMVIATVMNVAAGQAVESFSQMAQEKLEQANQLLDKQVERQQATLRRLTLELTDAEHHQRQQIASTLHDDFQQILVATRMKLELALQKGEPEREAVEAALGLVKQLNEISRNVTTDLHPVVLDHHGLPVAVQWLGDLFQQRYGLKVAVDLQVDPESGLGGMSLRRLVFDAVRELLFNIVKHARTDQAWIRICCDEQSPWRIEVEDRGVGSASMTPIAGCQGFNFGLASIHHRIEQIGGSVCVRSQPGEGTWVCLIVPLDAIAEHGEESQATPKRSG